MSKLMWESTMQPELTADGLLRKEWGHAGGSKGESDSILNGAVPLGTFR